MGPETNPTFAVGDHEAFMEFALIQAQKSPPAANKFCVGAVLVDGAKSKVLSTGYSLEYPRDYKGDPGTRTRSGVVLSRSPVSTTSPRNAFMRSFRPTQRCTRPWSRATRDLVAT